MRKLYFFVLISICTLPAFSQEQRKLQSYITFQYTNTLKDLTKGNNPWGMGSGFQMYYDLSTIFRPILEVTGDAYLENDKTLLLEPNGEEVPAVGAILKILVGPSLQVGPYVNASFTVGPTFGGGGVYTTFKPALHLFLNKKQSIFVKTAYIHVNNRGKVSREDFTSYSIGIGLKLSRDVRTTRLYSSPVPPLRQCAEVIKADIQTSRF